VPVLRAPKSRVAFRNTASTVTTIVLAPAVTVLLVLVMKRPHEGTLWHVAIFGPLGGAIGACLTLFYRLANPSLPEVAWNRDELRYRKGDDSLAMPWSDYDGYSFTRGFQPRLKLHRKAGSPMTIEHLAFTEDQRAELFA
jgi:hypothetical protein